MSTAMTTFPSTTGIVVPGDYVFSDPFAFRHLAQEDGTEIVEENALITGYQVYIVEQWACSRIHPVFVVTTFTGEETNQLKVKVLRILAAETYPDRLIHYFETLSEFHARPKDTPKGKIFVTNLSSFPSALTLIAVPDGDVDAHREEFIVNENLRRMGCTGRSALSLNPPSDATQDKFHQLYRTSDKINFTNTVIDLVKLVQSCLCLFGLFSVDYLDGLLCDITENSIIQWWNIHGTTFYDTEPTDGILGPTTVAGLLGMVLGIRYRLLSVRIEAPKDMMNVEHFREAIAHFQKQFKLERTRILDKPTLDRLYMLTVRSAVGEHRLPGHKTLRTTVHDLSNRTVVNAADIETCDIEEFITHLHGERLKYMWQGKGRRPSIGSVNTGLTPSQSFQDLKDSSMSKRHKVLRGVKSGAKEVGKIVRRGPESVIEKVQGQRNGTKREREREKETSEDMPLTAMEDYILTPMTTRDTEYVKDIREPPPLKTVARLQNQDIDTPRSSMSEPDSSLPVEGQSLWPRFSLERPKSACDEFKEHHNAWYPRRVSFSIAEDAVETWHYPFEIETDRIEQEVAAVSKWTEDQLDLVEECVDQIENKLRDVPSVVNSHTSYFQTVQSTSNQLRQRVNTFNEQTRNISDTTNKLRYAYSSADGLKEKMASVESVMEGIQTRMDKLNERLRAVEKIKLQYTLERRYRIRWLIMTGVCLCAGLLYLFMHLHSNKPEKLDLGGLEELL